MREAAVYLESTRIHQEYISEVGWTVFQSLAIKDKT